MPRKKKVDIEPESVLKDDISITETKTNNPIPQDGTFNEKLIDFIDQKFSKLYTEIQEHNKKNLSSSLEFMDNSHREFTRDTILTNIQELEERISESIDSKLSLMYKRLTDDMDKSIFAIESLVDEKYKDAISQSPDLHFFESKIHTITEDVESQIRSAKEDWDSKSRVMDSIIENNTNNMREEIRNQLHESQRDSEERVRKELQTFRDEFAMSLQTAQKECSEQIEAQIPREVQDLKSEVANQLHESQRDSEERVRKELQTFRDEFAMSLQTAQKECSEQIEAQIPREVQDLKSEVANQLHESQSEFEKVIRNDIQSLKNDTSEKIRTLKTNELKNVEDKIYHLSDYNTRLTLQNSSFEQKISGLLEKIKIYELEAEDRVTQVIKNIDQMIKKKMTEYNNRIISEKAEFEAILTQNTDVLEQIKNDSSFSEYLKNEIKNDLKESIEEYNKNIHYIIKNKTLQNELKKIDTHTTNILNNSLVHNDNIMLLKKLKNALDNSIMNK